MMILPKHRRKTSKWWEGRKLRVLHTIATNGGLVIPAGMIVTARRKWKGLEVEGSVCPHCGIKVRAKKCYFWSFKFIDIPPD